MNNEDSNILIIKILDRSYKIKCPVEQSQALQEAAILVDDYMRKARQSTPINSTEHIAVVTALNICNELIHVKKQKNNYIDVMNQRIQDLQHRIENFVAANEEVVI